MKKALSVILTLAIALSMVTMAFAENEPKYTIINPYAGVDWEKSETYKACLHCHTDASDGECPLKEWLGLYYAAGYDILAVTDHGVINNGWDKEKKTNGIFNLFKKVTPLTEEEYNYFTTGVDRDGRGMIDITGGIETNMAVVSKVHVNGYFTTWGQGVWGTENDYRSAPAAIEKAGGFSVLNHIGDWVNSNNYPERAHEAFYINYFANIFKDYKSCLGMEIINNTDNCTRADRELWDELLQVVIPTGRNIWGFADDDSEYRDEVGRSFELFPMQENTVENVKEAMQSGAFFAASKYQKNTKRTDEIEGDGLVPIVTNIVAQNDKISVTVDPDRSCTGIEWVADGKVISNDFTLDLNEHADEIGCYVRFVLKGTGGVTYSQAFELQYEGRVDKEIPASPIPDNFFGKILTFFYQTLPSALMELIVEKVLCKIGYLPKAAA